MHCVGQLPVAMTNTRGSFSRRKLGFCFVLFLVLIHGFRARRHLVPQVLLAFSCTVHHGKNENLLCSWKLGSQEHDRWRGQDPDFPLGDTPIVTYLSSIRPQFPMVPAPPKCISLRTKLSIWKPLGVSKIYSIHLSETKEYLNMESLSTTH